MRFGSQIYLAPGDYSSRKTDKIKKLVKHKSSVSGIEFLAIWCSGEPETYEMIIGVCEELGITPYLWFPVLADIDSFEIDERESVLLFDGSRGHGRAGKWEGLGGGEDFLFLCPNDNNSVSRNFAYFVKLLDNFNFGGVMLDRIRYPSFANGLESVYTCFCDECEFEFGNQPSLLEIKRCVRDKLGSLKSKKNISRIDTFLFGDSLKPLLTFKKRSITRVVSLFSDEAKRRGLKVGLDLFAPFLAESVGQDYKALSKHCDWVKPMLYRYAMGPAGLPLEVSCFVRAMNELCGRTIDKNELHANILRRELDCIAVKNLGDTEVYAGIEAIDDEGLGLSINPSIIRDYLDQIDGRADGVIASWNILQCSDENLRELRQRK